jgi:ribose-phosphate pyrophosphokinase
VPFDHLTAAPVLVDYLRHEDTSRMVIVSPDSGRLKVAERFSQQLGCALAVVHKTRPPGQTNTVEAREVIGEVDGRLCVLIDDMIDTASTICAAAERLVEAGATDVWAMDRLKASVISRVIVTNTLPLPEEHRIDKVEVLSIAPIIAEAIAAVFADRSVSEIFGGQNLS